MPRDLYSIRGVGSPGFVPGALGAPARTAVLPELEARYGGVGGRLFRQYAAEVERRLWRCPAYRALAPTAATN